MMNNKKTDKLNALLFGPQYCSDERLRSDIDKAGNYSFVFILFCIFLGMLYGLLFDHLDISIFSTVLFIGGGTVYLIFRIKLGSIYSENSEIDSPGKKSTLIKMLGVYAFSAILFAVITFVLRIIASGDLSSGAVLLAVKSSLLTAVLWVILFASLMSLIGFLSRRRTEKKIKGE